MDLSSWFLFSTVILAASISPGPNVLLVVVNTLSNGGRGGLSTIIGNLIALFSIALASALGVGAILEAAPSVFSLMKLTGGVYLAWMGFKLVRSSFGLMTEIAIEDESAKHGRNKSIEMVIQAMLTSYSNPKSILFLSSVFPAFLDTGYPLELQFTIMFMTIVGIVAAVHGVYACLALRMRQQLLSIKARRWMARFSGLSFLGFGAALAVDSQR